MAEQGIEECLVENDKVSQLETSCGNERSIISHFRYFLYVGILIRYTFIFHF